MHSQKSKVDSDNRVITMGTFDGVHVGHKYLLQKVIERAQKNNGKSVVLTYHNHPREILQKIHQPYLLTERECKEPLIKDCGIDEVVCLKFDYQLSLISAEDFFDRFIYQKFQPKEIVFGYDCHFGHLRKGDYHFLEKNKSKYGYKPLLVDPVKIDSEIVSSRRIRQLIRSGQVEKGSRMLGRNYDLQGVVVAGKRIGRNLGFPTINIQTTDPMKLIPASGVYLSQTYVDGKKYYCLTNVGYAPTLKNNTERQVECYLLNFSGDLYGKLIRIEYLHRIRNEMKFQSKEELAKAISKDKEYALRYLEDIGP